MARNLATLLMWRTPARGVHFSVLAVGKTEPTRAQIRTDH